MSGAAFGTAAIFTDIKNVKMYLAIAVSTRIDIICKKVTEITKNGWAIDCWLSELEIFLNKIKNKVAFIRRGIIAFVRNIGLLNIEFK